MSLRPAQITTAPTPRPGVARPGFICLLLACLLLAGCAATDWSERDRKVLWQHAQNAAARFSQALPEEKGYHLQAQFGSLKVNVVSRQQLAAEVIKRGGDPQRVTGFAEGNFESAQNPHQIWVVGGSGWVDQWALGHELAHVLGFDVDHLKLD
ncbi:MAG: hypothetical protein V1797_20295 [Pseudomonadota bacterium]